MDPITIHLDPLTLVLMVMYFLKSRHDVQAITSKLPQDHDGLLIAAMRREIAEGRLQVATPILKAGDSNHEGSGEAPDS